MALSFLSSAVSSQQAVLSELGSGAIYFMGLSFIVGSLFTIFILLVFDWIRMHNEKKELEEKLKKDE